MSDSYPPEVSSHPDVSFEVPPAFEELSLGPPPPPPKDSGESDMVDISDPEVEMLDSVALQARMAQAMDIPEDRDPWAAGMRRRRRGSFVRSETFSVSPCPVKTS